MKKSAASVLAATCLLAACAGFEKPAPGADYGRPPVNAERALRGHFEAVLLDSESARYRLDSARRAYLNNGLMHGGRIVDYGWMVPFQVNAKNRFGGYVGFKPHIAFFARGELRYVFEGDSHPLVNFPD